MADHIAHTAEYMPCPVHGEHDAWVMVRWSPENAEVDKQKVIAMCMKCNVEAMFAAGVTCLEVLPPGVEATRPVNKVPDESPPKSD